MTLLGLGVREEAVHVRRAGRLTFREVSAAAALVHFAPFAFLKFGLSPRRGTQLWWVLWQVATSPK